MSIQWASGPKAGQVEYAGAVLHVGTRTVRVMSDVWDDERYATVWDGEKVVDLILRDWAYEAVGGGWTKDEKNAVSRTVTNSYGSYETHDRHEFYPLATVDATEEVRAAVDAYERLNALISSTRDRLTHAGRISAQKEVEVYRGRKVPHGVYETTCNVREGAYGSFVHLRDKDGTTHSFVSVDNMRVVRPVRYVEGEVACGCCRRTFVSAQAANMEVDRHWSDGHCGECRLNQVLDGHRDVPLPSTAPIQGFPAFKDRPALRGTGPGEGLVRAVFENPEDATAWLILCDWLEDAGDERHIPLRAALGGTPRKKAAPIRKKDLKVSPWRLAEKHEVGGWTVYECVVTGFPPTKDFDRVVVRKIVGPGRTWPMRFYGWKSDEGDFSEQNCHHPSREVSGTLLRQCKAVVPQLVVPAEAG